MFFTYGIFYVSNLSVPTFAIANIVVPVAKLKQVRGSLVSTSNKTLHGIKTDKSLMVKLGNIESKPLFRLHINVNPCCLDLSSTGARSSVTVTANCNYLWRLHWHFITCNFVSWIKILIHYWPNLWNGPIWMHLSFLYHIKKIQRTAKKQYLANT